MKISPFYKIELFGELFVDLQGLHLHRYDISNLVDVVSRESSSEDDFGREDEVPLAPVQNIVLDGSQEGAHEMNLLNFLRLQNIA